MSRHRPPIRRWRIGDRVMAPWYAGYFHGSRRYGPRPDPGGLRGWHPAVVELVRGDRVVVREYGYERILPCWELRSGG